MCLVVIAILLFLIALPIIIALLPALFVGFHILIAVVFFLFLIALVWYFIVDHPKELAGEKKKKKQEERRKENEEGWRRRRMSRIARRYGLNSEDEGDV